MVITVNINNNSKCHCRLCRTDSYREQGEEETFKLSREKETVEYSKVKVNRVQHQLNRNEHGNQVATRNKAKDTNEEQKCAEHEIHANRNSEMNSKGNTY